ncbi:MAG TPA: dihydropteroate synthase [Candidatus Dormibacteraeota bacterium]|nr:dihydropteroate synthase [Candidatus Dormibacteraeota bacterium]
MVPIVTTKRGTLDIGSQRFTLGERTLLMGIVNVTPDSFSGDGRAGTEEALARALEQAAAGADILDIGGESTRPGHQSITPELESERVVPVIRAVRDALPDLPISVDTYKPLVARAALAAGADCVNSIWGLPDALLDVVLESGAAAVAMHNRHAIAAGAIVPELIEALRGEAERAISRGLPRSRLVLDPGIGFGKTPDQNIDLLASLDRLVALGFPTLLGTSRKSTIGALTGRSAPEERVFGTAASTALAVAAGIDIVRVHDVAAMRDVLAVADAIVREWRPAGWTK